MRRAWRTGLVSMMAAGLLHAAVATDAQSRATPRLPDDCHCGVLAARAGTTLVEKAADRLYTPASVQKLVVAAAALHHLGPDFHVATDVLGPPPDMEGVVRGDLVILGRGDPTWNDHHFEDEPHEPLRRLAEALYKRGVRRLEGDLVLDGTTFPGRETPPDWPVGDLSFAYGAVPSALAVDRNATRLSMRPGRRVGDPAPASVEGPVELVNRAITAPAELHGDGTIEFQVQWDDAQILARGEFPISEKPFRIKVAVPQPLWVVGQELIAAFGAAGITWQGQLRVVDGWSAVEETTAVDDRRVLLARMHSAPLREWMEPLLADSDNWYAEMLLRILALETRGEGRLGLGLEVEGEFLEEVVGISDDQYAFDDASGLSPFNLLSPRATVGLLQWVMEQEWFEVYEMALASDSQGTLGRSWANVPRLRAKTGSLTHVQTLAGYDHSLPGEPTVFAIFSNGRTASRWQMKRDILGEIRAWRPQAEAAQPRATQGASR